jgi:small subunit ribosomal protein S17
VSRIKLFLPYMVRKRTFKKIMAHDEGNECGMGDIVRIKPSRPLSKRKAFTLHEILRKDPKLSLQQQQAQQAGAGAAGKGQAAASAGDSASS